jgi:hypothetical protein
MLHAILTVSITCRTSLHTCALWTALKSDRNGLRTGERSVALSENGRSSLCITLKGMVINKQPPTETARGRL